MFQIGGRCEACSDGDCGITKPTSPAGARPAPTTTTLAVVSEQAATTTAAPKATTTTQPTATAAPACKVDAAGCLSAREVEHFNLLNAKRAEGFTCPEGAVFAPNPTKLVFDCRLWKASRLHSEDMGEHGYFSHTSQDGRSPWNRADAQGLSANGENIAAGRSGADDVLQQWLKSDGHCRNMGQPSFLMAAIGHAEVARSPYGHYWTQMFRSSLATPDHTCVPTGLGDDGGTPAQPTTQETTQAATRPSVQPTRAAATTTPAAPVLDPASRREQTQPQARS